MIVYRRALSLLMMPLIVPQSPAVAESRRMRVGEVSDLSGEAVARFSDDQPRSLAPAAALLMEDLITTGPAARLVGRLEGGIELRLGERTSLRVDALTLRGPRPGTEIRVFEGPVLLDRPRSGTAPDAPITMILPWARIGVRGTRFFAGPLDGRYAVFVARGEVQVQAGGATAILQGGDGVDVLAPGAPPGPVVRWGQARIDRALALVS